jgi:hypothetical protein
LIFVKVEVGSEVPEQKIRILRDNQEGNGPLAFRGEAAALSVGVEFGIESPRSSIWVRTRIQESDGGGLKGEVAGQNAKKMSLQQKTGS